MKRFVILGGGISGLSLLWYLKKQLPDASIKLLEKDSRVGGWIRSEKKEGFLFEKGPRSLQTRGKGIYTLNLIEELGLEKEVISADPNAAYRYLFINGKLQRLPHNLLSFLTSPFIWKAFPSLITEWKTKAAHKDESIYAFFNRHFGSYVTETFIDPLVSGIYAGNMRELSIQACFPRFFEIDQKHGSFFKAGIKHLFSPKKSKQIKSKSSKPFSLFSFKEGLETLPKKLYHNLKESIYLECEVLRIEQNSNGIDITLNNGEKIEADYLFSTLPSYQLLSIMPQSFKEVLEELTSLQHASVAVVNLGYRRKVLDKQGFGYLVPQKEQQSILGMVWDSSVFPEQSESKEKTRLTVMLGGTRDLHFMNKSKEDFLKIALDAVKQHLNIIEKPDAIEVTIASQAIPQYPVDYQSKINVIQTKLNAIDSRFSFSGTSFAGVSVNDCIANSYEISISCLRRIFNT